MYLHPAHVTERLIAKWQRARVVPYLDMPVQHGDDGILRAMRRGVTARRMKDIVARLRDAIPGVTLRTTRAGGLPGRDGGRVREPARLRGGRRRFDRLGVFTYSVEEGTPAADMGDQVPAEVMAERAQQVQDLQDRLAWPRQKALFGTAPDRAGGRAERGLRVPLRGPDRRPGARDRRRGAAAQRARSPPAASRTSRIVEVEGYELVGE